LEFRDLPCLAIAYRENRSWEKLIELAAENGAGEAPARGLAVRCTKPSSVSRSICHRLQSGSSSGGASQGQFLVTSQCQRDLR
jgi:hypothetical protein